MKISLLSVAPPYRGGISDQSSQLYENLKGDHDVNIINFKRQYPNFLFPGKTQYEESAVEIGEYNHRVIDSINPLTWIKAIKLLRAYSPDLIILRFWNPYFAICHAFIIKRVKKYLKNLKVICICDNIYPHEKHFYDKILIRKLFKHVDGFLVMSEKVEEELLTFSPKSKYRRTFHPIITEAPTLSRQESKVKIGFAGKKIILFFGLIRKYKGLDTLIRANKLLNKKLSNYQILICGESYQDKEYYYKLINENSISNEIKWINKFIPNDEVATFFSAADVVVLPYKSASQSGIIPLSYAYNRPVIASDIKGIREMIVDGDTGFLFERDNHSLLSNKIQHFFSEKKDYKDNIENFRRNFSWNSFVQEIEGLYKCL